MTGIFVSPYATSQGGAPNGQNYMMPGQAKSSYDYAAALLKNSQQPVHHWTQGVSNMVNALMGGNLDYETGQRERAALEADNAARAANVPDSNFPQSGAAPVPFSGSPTSEGSTKSDGGPKVASSDDPRAAAIAGIESRGSKDPYHLHGPTIINPRSAYFGDQAHGKYQVMGKNIGPWTQEVLGRAMTPQEFDNDPAAQEAVFKAKFTNPRDWFGHGKSDGYMTGDNYVRQYQANLAKAGGAAAPGPSQPMAFAGPTQSEVSQAPAVQAMQNAMGGGMPASAPPAQVAGPQMAAGPKVPPVQAPAPKMNPAPGGGPIINPSLIQKPPAYQSREALVRAMSTPWLGQAAGDEAYHMGLQQNQPMFMPSPTGSGQILVNPNNPGSQQYFAAPPHFSPTEMGGIKVERPVTFDQHGVPITQTPVPTAPAAPAAVGPRSEAAPAATPGTPAAENAPEPAAAPTKVASLNPASALSKSTPAPDANTIVPPQGNINATGPLTKFAQAGAPPDALSKLVGSDVTNAYAAKQAYDNAVALRQEEKKKDLETGMKAYTDFSTKADANRQLEPQIDEAMKLMKDPNFNAGMASGLKDTWNRFKETFMGEKGANMANEVFDKQAASVVLNTMKTALGGLGQVRLAEINLLSKANANRYYGPASNRAVLDIAKRGVQKINMINDMAQEYKNHQDVVDPVTRKILLPASEGTRLGLDSGFNQLISGWAKEQNERDADHYAKYEDFWKTGIDPDTKEQENERPNKGDKKQFKQGIGVWDGEQWVPEKSEKK